MAKVLSRRDMGVDCDFVARSKTVDEVLQQATEHGRKAHNTQQLTPEMQEKALPLIREQYSGPAGAKHLITPGHFIPHVLR